MDMGIVLMDFFFLAGLILLVNFAKLQKWSQLLQLNILEPKGL